MPPDVDRPHNLLARVLGWAVGAIVPSLTAFLATMTVFTSPGAFWLPMTAAVVVSAAFGGMAAGLVATLMTAALSWWFLVPPAHTFGAAVPVEYVSLVLFLSVGFAVSLLHERLRRTADGLARAAHQNQLLGALIENSQDFIAIAKPDGTLSYINEGGRRMVGMPADVAVEQTSVPDYYPADVRDFARDTILRATAAHGTWTGETVLRHWRTDVRIPVNDMHFLIRDPVRRLVIGIGTITRDISTQKAQRDELERINQQLAATVRELGESQRSLQGILDHSPNAIVIKSLDGRYLIVNNGFSAIHRVATSDMQGKTDAELFPAALGNRLRANDEQAIATRRAVVTEEVLEQDGERCVFVVTKFPLFDEANAIYAIGSIWTDISGRKRYEDKLARAANDLRRAQQVAHVGSWRSDLQTGEVEWSEELYRIFGLDPAEPRKKLVFLDPADRILTEESRARARAAVEKLSADGIPCQLDLEFTRPDGTSGWVAVAAEAVRDANGRVIGVDDTAADITRIKELQRLQEEWTSVIAHDLRQPIGTILMVSGLLPDIHGEMAEQERDLVERVHVAAGTLNRMVGDLLDVSLLEANRLKLVRKPTNPATLVHETVERLAHLSGIERVHISEDGECSEILIDPMRIEQVVTNLVSNALKYGDANTDITIQVSRRPNETEISVTNRGPGISSEDLPRLFSRFARSRATRGSGVPGLGLGLYIAKGVVQAHGGRLWAESTPGETTTFHVVLPASPDGASSIATSKVPDSQKAA